MTGVAGGITEAICIVRCKGRFGRPTSGGWADIMLNFHFEVVVFLVSDWSITSDFSLFHYIHFRKDDSEWTHLCEIQLVHAELYNVRKNMGAHRSYIEFRAALELCEKVGVDPEEGSDPSTLEALVWTPGQQRSSVSEMTATASYSEGTLLSKLETTLLSKLESNHLHLMEQMAVLQEQNERQSANIAALEMQIKQLCPQSVIRSPSVVLLPS